ncbi:hypothetical protein Cgig2_005667 [Carnegiea gigantea]|uniref:t-SNARE coiled-coil homology domain-containing protein n=1 Tax=Carnegiea gigantea TaxID=171969 RepID=A0A9Q1KTN8_9CARY|nr:hypothetical protein Cgig2_005667 [Carnegiea gigantea]
MFTSTKQVTRDVGSFDDEIMNGTKGYDDSIENRIRHGAKHHVVNIIDKLLSSFHQWEHVALDAGERLHLSKELLAGCESIEWQLHDRKIDELDKAISVAARDPAYYGIDEVELEKRRRWTKTARDQVGNVKKTVSAGKGPSYHEAHRELMRLPRDHSYQTERSNQCGRDNDDFISSESDRQLLLMKEQDEELDELSASVQRIGHVGLSIHDELLAQEKIIDDLGNEMDSTKNRLDFLQVI